MQTTFMTTWTILWLYLGTCSTLKFSRHDPRQASGTLSGLRGNSAALEDSTSPGEREVTTSSFAAVPISKNKTSSLQSQGPSYSATCPISFEDSPSQGTTKNSAIPAVKLKTQSPTNNTTRLSAVRRDSISSEPQSEDERSAIFMTENAQKCVDAVKADTNEQIKPLVAICYSLGYVDEKTGDFGGHLTVFRIGDTSEVEGKGGMTIEELSQESQLKLDFEVGSDEKDEARILSPLSYAGALRLSQLPLAPLDYPTDLSKTRNPQFTAQIGEKEMVLIGSFHLSMDNHMSSEPANIPELGLDSGFFNFAPSSAILIGKGSTSLPTKLFALDSKIRKRSRIISNEPWGLFKRQTQNSRSNSTFTADSTCLLSGPASNPFFAGTGTRATSGTSQNSTTTNQRNQNLTLTSTRTPTSGSSFQRNSTGLAPTPNSPNAPQIAAVVNDTGSGNSTTFQLPGRTLMVTPVGLAIFGALSVITVTVVGLVTYERLKYRKQFREGKMLAGGPSNFR